jgi:trehalose/maltose transport system substrate-binding protein
VRGQVGFTALPLGGPKGRHSATLGGWQLAVSRHSRHPELAVDLVRYLTSAQVQRERTLAAALVPTRPALFDDPAVREAQPLIALLAEDAVDLVARPAAATGARYPEVSGLIQSLVFDVLQGRLTGEEAMEAITDEFAELRAGGMPW